MRIGLVSAFPPSTGPLSEYGWHLAHAVAANARVSSLHVLADRAAGAIEYHAGKLHVVPCWSFDHVAFPAAVLAAARQLPLDVLWFNQHLTSTGNSRPSWFAGLTAPAMARAAGFTTIVTLHNMLGLTDLTRVGPRVTRIDRYGAHLATWLLRAADGVCVLRPEYEALLRDRYALSHVHYLAHGTLGTPSPHASMRPDPILLAFGHFGGYKRLEDLIAVVRELSQEGCRVRLQIGGSDSRHNPGYLARMRAACVDDNVEFLGYVPEPDVPNLFQRAAVSVLPYATITGMSGVVVQSAMYGVPMVASDIPPFRALQREGLRMNYFEWMNRCSLKHALQHLLSSPSYALSQADANLAYSRTHSMDTTVNGYLDLAENLLARGRRAPRLAFSGS